MTERGRPSQLRRHALRAVASVAVTTFGLLALAGCASRPPAVPPAPIALLAVLPVVVAPNASGSGFGARAPVVFVGAPVGSRGSSSGGAAAAIGVGVVAAVIAISVEQGRRKDRDALADALLEVKFDPIEQLNRQLAAALEQTQVRIVHITDAAAAADIRAGRLAALPGGVDAILDVRVGESGFYASSRAGGLSPMLLVNANIVGPYPGANHLGSFEYYADWRENAKDKRWVTTPREMTFNTTEHLKAEAASARAGLESVVQQFVALIAADVKCHAAGELSAD